MKFIKSAALLALAFTGVPALQGQTVGSFDDIRFWTGSGTNRAALILQWNDGGAPSSLAWGFRWNGDITGLDMLVAVAGTTIIREPGGGDVIETLSGADPRLVLTIERYGFGDAVYSMVLSDPSVTRAQEDWSSGYWVYWLYAGEFDYFTFNYETFEFDGPFTYSEPGTENYADVTWFQSEIGASDRMLVDGGWDVWNFAAGFVNHPVAQPSAVPLPVPATAIRFEGALPTVEAASVEGLFYQLEFTDDFGEGWTSAGPKVPGTGEVMEFHDMTHPLPGRRFYRIAVTQ